MPNIKILIVEDNESYALEIQILIDQLGYESVGVASRGTEVFEMVKVHSPDLILMDVQIKGDLTGIEVAEKIHKDNSQIAIIYITSFDDRNTFDAAQKTKNFGYIVKPFNQLTLEAAIETAIMSLEDGDFSNSENFDKTLEELETFENNSSENVILKDRIFIKKRRKLKKVEFKEILFIEADGNYSLVTTDSQKFILKKSLIKVSELLDSPVFFKISRGMIINLERIDSIDLATNKATIGDLELSISRQYRSELLQQLKLLT